jgi:hypothetical protein
MDPTKNNSEFYEIKIVQINLQKCISATHLLLQFMYENQIDIALVQEPYLVDNIVALIPINFHVFQSQNRSKSAIIVNPIKLQLMPLNEHINEFSVWCVFKSNNKLIHICSLYIPPDTNPNANPESIIDSTNNAINKLKPTYYLIGSDTNGKSKLW